MTAIEIVLLILVIVLIIAIGTLLVFMYKKNKQPISMGSQNDNLVALNAKLEMIQEGYSNMQKTMSVSGQDSATNLSKLSEKIETMDKFQKDLNKFNTEIKTNLDNLHNSTKNIPSISSELKGISDIYKHAKNRGNFGEFQLKVILDDIFGNNKELVQEQYRLDDKSIVDFVVNIGNHVVPIDSKFPLDNYKKIIESENTLEIEKYKQTFKRDIVNKFKEVSKYVSPSKGIDNVIIFIPSEAIFSDINA
jgi:DNA recombination protein RmuC